MRVIVRHFWVLGHACHWLQRACHHGNVVVDAVARGISLLQGTPSSKLPSVAGRTEFVIPHHPWRGFTKLFLTRPLNLQIHDGRPRLH